jgi:hypothetical protein
VLGTWIAIGGYALWAMTLVFRIVDLMFFRRWLLQAIVIGFYARAAATVGLMAIVLGAIAAGTVSWLLLILVFVLGTPSLALLLVRPVRADLASFGFGSREEP